MIRYLKQEEKTNCRALWESVFDEDSKSFIDYYFSDRVRKNKILTAWEDGQVIAMLHRNPYHVAVKDRIWKVDYIAGVATDPAWRHQGYMAKLLERCFSDMYVERKGFCFLVPVSPVIYHPFNFTYICDLPQRSLNEKGLLQLSHRAFLERADEYKEAARFVGRVLEKDFEVYAIRDEEYYRDLCKEVRSDKGDLVLLYTREERERLAGIYAYYGENAETQRELICLPEYLRTRGPLKPAVMGRIIHLKQFVSVIRLKEECPVSEMELFIEVKDHLIRQNSGVFCWKLGKEGSKLIPVDENCGIKPHLSMDIGEMTSWLFGYTTPSVTGDRREMIEKIRPLQGAYFDEIT
jgi:predicted acetyltransferase